MALAADTWYEENILGIDENLSDEEYEIPYEELYYMIIDYAEGETTFDVFSKNAPDFLLRRIKSSQCEEEQYVDEPREEEQYVDEPREEEQSHRAGYFHDRHIAGEEAESSFEMRLNCIGFPEGLDGYDAWVENDDPQNLDGNVSDAEYDKFYEDLHELIVDYASDGISFDTFYAGAPEFMRNRIKPAPCD